MNNRTYSNFPSSCFGAEFPLFTSHVEESMIGDQVLSQIHSQVQMPEYQTGFEVRPDCACFCPKSRSHNEFLTWNKPLEFDAPGNPVDKMKQYIRAMLSQKWAEKNRLEGEIRALENLRYARETGGL